MKPAMVSEVDRRFVEAVKRWREQVDLSHPAVRSMVDVLTQAVEYLDRSSMESIHSGSVLHQRMKSALEEIK